LSRVRKKDRTGRKRASKNVTALVGLPGPEPRRGCALFGVGTLRNLVMICHVKGISLSIEHRDCLFGFHSKVRGVSRGGSLLNGRLPSRAPAGSPASRTPPRPGHPPRVFLFLWTTTVALYMFKPFDMFSSVGDFQKLPPPPARTTKGKLAAAARAKKIDIKVRRRLYHKLYPILQGKAEPCSCGGSACCQAQEFMRGRPAQILLKWHQFWCGLRRPDKVNTLLREFRRVWPLGATRLQRQYSFLGHRFCSRSWRLILGVNPTRALRFYRKGLERHLGRVHAPSFPLRR
jgi:hypothetical protein